MKAGIINKLLVGIGLLTVLAVAAGVLMNWDSVRIHYHVMLLQDARRPIASNEAKVRYSTHWVRWLAEGRPDRQTQSGAGWKHEDALIKLGYCERHVYTLTNGTVSELGKAITGHRFKDGLLTIETAGGMDKFVVFAAKEDFPFVETKIKEVETQEKKQ
jgi:hypothetical protein